MQTIVGEQERVGSGMCEDRMEELKKKYGAERRMGERQKDITGIKIENLY
jgi:hypothetical protein